MKILITGASGIIGGASYRYCVEHPDITSVVTLTRRALPSDNPKHRNIVVKDFKQWDSVLDEISDADAMIWAMGTSDGNEDANINYPLAFQEQFAKAMSEKPHRDKRFRYLQVSGIFVEHDPNRSLYFLSKPRKVKGIADTRSLQFAAEHKDVWQTFILTVGMVATGNSLKKALPEMIFGQNMVIRAEDLGAFAADLAVHGNEAEGFVPNGRMATRGKELRGATDSNAKVS